MAVIGNAQDLGPVLVNPVSQQVLFRGLERWWAELSVDARLGVLRTMAAAGEREAVPLPADPRPSITCPACGRTSWHPQDVAAGYCGNCHDWTNGEVKYP